MKALILIVSCLLGGASTLALVGQASLNSGSTALPFEYEFEQTQLEETGLSIIIEGQSEEVSQLIIVRIDDVDSKDYYSRANIERYVSQGKFELEIPLQGLKSSGGRLLNVEQLTKIIIFTPGPSDTIELSKVELVKSMSLPKGVRVFDLGPANGATLANAEVLTPSSPWVQGTRPTSISRTYDDPLLKDGIQNIDAINIPLANGSWSVSLWTEDVGEWEYLPPTLNRWININGERVFHRQMSPYQWITHKYLELADNAYTPGQTPWDMFGARRGNRIDHITQVTQGTLVIQLGGHLPRETFISAIVVTPDNSFSGTHYVIEQQKKRFNQHWTLAKLAPYTAPNQLRLSGPLFSDSQLMGIGGQNHIEFFIESPEQDASPQLVVTPPQLNGKFLDVMLGFGQASLTPESPQSRLLSVNYDRLIYQLDQFTLSANHKQPLTLSVFSDPATTPGIYRGNVQLISHKQVLVQPYAIEVLPAVLPELTKPVGPYHDEAPHFSWFPQLTTDSNQSLDCDVNWFNKFGITNVAPRLSTPDDAPEQFQQDIRRAVKLSAGTPMMAYTPLKRLLAKHKIENSIVALADAQQQVIRLGAQAYWSITDEPHADQIDWIKANLLILQNALPNAKFAGHLNNVKSQELIDALDLILINNGFGVSKYTIENIKKRNKTVWLYNLNQERLAAGLYLWQVQADGLLQWHSRMPTANPFDPTDGREADVQFIYPSKSSCYETPSFNKKLLNMSQGINDHRWLLWLEQQSRHNPEAQTLLTNLHKRIPNEFGLAMFLTNDDVHSLIQDIKVLAQRLR